MAAHGHAGHGHDAHGHGHEAHAHGHPTLRDYNITFAWLMGLLILTIVAAMLNLNVGGLELNLPVALAIAAWKVYWVMSNFMHVKFNSNLVKLFALCAFFWLLILFGMTSMDYVAREWQRAPGQGG